MRKRGSIFFISLAMLLQVADAAFCQKVEVSVNRNNILIGEQISYGLKVIAPQPGFAVHFKIPDSIPHFDIIRKEEVKSVPGTPPAVEQVIVFTSFDSGSWAFPSIPVLLTDGRKQINLASSTVMVEVGYSPEDTMGLRDIKPIRLVKIPDYTMYYIIAGIILLALIAWLIFRYLKKRKNKPAKVFTSTLSPYDEAIRALDEISMSADPVKSRHLRISDTFKTYLSRIKNENLLNNTTGDLLIELQDEFPDAALTGKIAEVLRLSDAVKYAKYSPPENETGNAIEKLKEGIGIINRTSVKS